MQVSAGQYSLCSAKIPKLHSCSSSLSFLFFSSKSSIHRHFLPSLVLKNVGVIYALESGAETSTEETNGERWLLEPVGDGDSRHIGFKVSMPGAFEIASTNVTIGRLPEKADIVIPVATVSGVHARIEKKDGVLLVTDLDSTNGTFIGENRLTPGVAAPMSSGSVITFGDTNLAIFRVSKLENAEVPRKSEKSEAKA